MTIPLFPWRQIGGKKAEAPRYGAIFARHTEQGWEVAGIYHHFSPQAEPQLTFSLVTATYPEDILESPLAARALEALGLAAQQRLEPVEMLEAIFALDTWQTPGKRFEHFGDAVRAHNIPRSALWAASDYDDTTQPD